MKIVLHMGQAKTGTTSLQESFHAAAVQLRRQGVLYPTFGEGFVSHHLLLGLCGSVDHLPPWTLDRLGGAESAVATARRAWDGMLREIRENRPEVLVLSSEYLLFRTGTAAKAPLADLLGTLSDDITPVIYVRHPVDLFRSLMQQFLKHRDGPFPPREGNLRQQILATEAAFGKRPELVAFDRKVLHQGDIVRDFATRFLAPQVDPAGLPSLNDNVSLSAEALVLLARLRDRAGGTYEAARQASGQIKVLHRLDRSDPPERPMTLLPEVAEAALRCATGHRWLAETGLLQIPGLDIDRIDGAPAPEWMTTAPATALFGHDPDRLERLSRAMDRHLAKTATPTGANRVLRFLLGRLSAREQPDTADPRRR